MATSRSHLVDEDRSRCTILVNRAVLHLSQIVLQCRTNFDNQELGEPAPSPYFNLKIPVVKMLNKDVESYQANVNQPFFVSIIFEDEVSPHGKPKNYNPILERWKFDCDPSTPSNDTIAVAYRNMTILLRAVYAYSRILPCFRLFNHLKKIKTSKARISYKLDNQLTPLPQNPPFVFQSLSFGPVTTPIGSFAVTLMYRKELSYELSIVSEVLSRSELIVQDYNPQAQQRPGAQTPAVAVPQQTVPTASYPQSDPIHIPPAPGRSPPNHVPHSSHSPHSPTSLKGPSSGPDYLSVPGLPLPSPAFSTGISGRSPPNRSARVPSFNFGCSPPFPQAFIQRVPASGGNSPPQAQMSVSPTTGSDLGIHPAKIIPGSSGSLDSACTSSLTEGSTERSRSKSASKGLQRPLLSPFVDPPLSELDNSDRDSQHLLTLRSLPQEEAMGHLPMPQLTAPFPYGGVSLDPAPELDYLKAATEALENEPAFSLAVQQPRELDVGEFALMCQKPPALKLFGGSSTIPPLTTVQQLLSDNPIEEYVDLAKDTT